MQNTNQPSRQAFDGVTLSAAYTDNAYVIDVAGFDKVSLDIDYTVGSGELASELNFKLEHSSDGTNWYSLAIDETGGTSVITPRVWEVVGTMKVNILVDMAYKQVRMSLIETDKVTNSGVASVDFTLSRLG